MHILECFLLFVRVSVSLSNQVLQDVREDLRASMAKDIVTIKNEGFKIEEEPNRQLIMSATDEERLSEPSSLDFQKKITLSKHEKQDASSNSVLQNGETYKRLFGMQILYSCLFFKIMYTASLCAITAWVLFQKWKRKTSS